ncbi:MAG: HD domain-containing protein [Oscillospiraceae bacterium]
MNGQAVMIIDDIGENSKVLSEMLKEKYTVIVAKDLEEAAKIARLKKNKIVLILINLSLFQSGGKDAINALKKAGSLGKISVVAITEDSSNESEKLAYTLGAADTIKKPFNISFIIEKKVSTLVDIFNYQNNLEVLLRVQNKKILSQSQKLVEKTEMLNKINVHMMESISSVVEWRDWETGKHVKRIRCFTESLLNNVAMKFPEYELKSQDINIIAMASTTHDIGKIAIPDAILLKPGKLSAEEFEIMKTHTTKGGEMICSFNDIDVNNYLSYCKEICLCHHEKWDGRGYPNNLGGDEIPIWAQVVSIADCFDALISDRPYKKAFTYKETATMILNGECGAFSPKIIGCFKDVLVEFENLARVYRE